MGSGDAWTEVSEPLTIEAGLLDHRDWQQELISPSTIGGLTDGAPLMFGQADLLAQPVSARLYLTAHGIVEFSINGERVGDDVFAPGWTAYDKAADLAVGPDSRRLRPEPRGLGTDPGERRGRYRPCAR